MNVSPQWQAPKGRARAVNIESVVSAHGLSLKRAGDERERHGGTTCHFRG
jgi:hypothetical protein